MILIYVPSTRKLSPTDRCVRQNRKEITHHQIAELSERYGCTTYYKYPKKNMQNLPVNRIVKEAVLIVWRKRFMLLQALIGTGVALASLDMARNHALEKPHWVFVLLFSVSSAIIFTLFAVTCHRIILMGEATVPRYGIHSWTRRELRFLGWTIVGYCYFIGITMIIGMPTAFVSSILFTYEFTHKIFQVFGYAVWLPGAYVFARLAILLPATAIDERHDMKWAWDLTSNNGWRLAVVVILLPGLLAAAVDFFEIRRYLIIEFILHLLSYALMAIEIAVLSVSFRFLADATTASNEAASAC